MVAALDLQSREDPERLRRRGRVRGSPSGRSASSSSDTVSRGTTNGLPAGGGGLTGDGRETGDRHWPGLTKAACRRSNAATGGGDARLHTWGVRLGASMASGSRRRTAAAAAGGGKGGGVAESSPMATEPHGCRTGRACTEEGQGVRSEACACEPK